MKKLRILIVSIFMFQQAVAPVVFAQADKQFQDELQGPVDEGGPILDEPGQAAEPAAPEIPKAQPPGTPIQSVQIGGQQKEAPLYEEAETVSPLDRKIGPIRLKGAPLSTFLDIVSAQSKVNFILTEGIEAKTITVFLRKTTVREALELLLRIKGLTYQRIGKSNTYVVMKRSADQPNLITKIYTLNYIPLIQISSVKEEQADIVAGDTGSSMGPQGGGATGGVIDLPPGVESRQAEPDDEKGIALLRVIRSVQSRKYGKLALDTRTNSVIVTDIPEVFPQIEQIIAELDKKAPQILIEAQIVEINTDRLNELGIEWGGSRGEMAYFAGPARLTDYGVRPGFLSGNAWKYFYPAADKFIQGPSEDQAGGELDPIFSTKISGERGLYYGIFSLAQLQAIFRALISKGEGRYLGKPKVVAMNNKTSLIQITRDAAIGTGSVVASAGGSAGTSSSSIERKRIGLKLRVTPQVNKEGYVTLMVIPSYSDIIASAISSQGQTIMDPVSRGASTMVRVKNGQTVVIGGMLSSTESKAVKKVPLLGYIPIIGWLFTSVTAKRTNTDLVIFITPTILVD
ncbi:MAG: hypothetical protein HY746_01620 [Elusimicrobia bacterium]|nr:hypothetical protein [Elusimicrobiota bacterium]